MKLAFASAFAIAIPLLAAPAASKAEELFTPALPANSVQYQECRIVNVSAVQKKVVVEAFSSTGALTAGPSPQILAPGEAGGFSIPGYYASMYCKFTVKGPTSDYRASIDVFDPANPFRIVVSLPAT